MITDKQWQLSRIQIVTSMSEAPLIRGFIAKGENAQVSMRNKFHLCEPPETETHVCEVSRKRN